MKKETGQTQTFKANCKNDRKQNKGKSNLRA